MKKIISLIIGIIMTTQTFIIGNSEFYAPTLSQDEWSEVYSSLCNGNELPTLNVGADETQVSLCWHADADKAVAEVRLAKNAEMNDSISFKGATTPAEK